MQLNLTKDLVFFDVETTGLNVMRDRILQIGLLKIYKDGRPEEELKLLINPGIPISEESMSIHGITPADVRNKPTFDQVAEQIYKFIGDADLGGYNSNRFDVPMLLEEFDRAGFDFSIEGRRLIDVQRIFYKMEPRTLRAAYRYYCDAEIQDAHDAMADVKATYEVFKGQLNRYEGENLIDEDGNEVVEPIKNDMQVIHDFINDLRFIDVTQRLRIEMDGTVVFNFGKYTGQAVDEVLKIEPRYAYWILDKEFSVQVKQYIRSVMK